MFLFNIGFYTLMCLQFIRKYWNKSYTWRHKEHSHITKFLDYDIAIHSVMIKNLDATVPVDEMTKLLRGIFDGLFPGGGKIIQCKALGRMD